MIKQSPDTLFDEMNKCNQSGKHKTAVIVFKQDNFNKPFSEAERSYRSHSDQWGWNYERAGKCRIGDCLDGKDIGVRLDYYDWTIEYWYWDEPQEISESKSNAKAQRGNYVCLNRSGSFDEALTKHFNGNDIVKSQDKILWSSVIDEGIDYEFPSSKKGGIIVFSTDINAIQMSDNRFMDWFKQKAATVINRMAAVKKIDRISQRYKLDAWTIGKYFSGRYTSKSGKPFGENSMSVELIGISTDKLIDIAEELCRDFRQETVLVKCYDNQKILLVNPAKY